ncbi:putative methylesterase 11, chloroplastic [Iris pallida]|uniref:Methylesterase 11, chloroplastic n=1 Tax=Iris pallida TaxID=29817 RepID=A0AAX6G397_IRIPA|nr:putative methylesterase 11, chloroplastic [Iris pallida]KAJ6841656.1 putative methylesterase 11, chloroplastic [Iris pallida]
MGAILSCFYDEAVDDRRRRKTPPHRRNPSSTSSFSGVPGSSSRFRPGRKDLDEAVMHDQALAAAAAAFILQQHQNGGRGVCPGFDRSSSLRFPPAGGGGKKQGLPRSSSSRARSLADPVVQPQQLVNPEVKVEDMETVHFVLVHGGGFGAWCWYKTIALLEDSGFKVNAIDLTGSGIHSFDTNNIKSLPQYVKPLTTFLEKLGDGEKVILVGHDFGGACISYAMEVCPSKVAKAVFVTAAMLKDGQSTLDMFSQQDGADDLMRPAQVFLYANGKDKPPTAIDLDKSLLKDLLFNQSPVKDVALASVSMRAIPFAPVLEKLSLTESNYGSVRRFYIETSEDNAIPLSLQQRMCDANPPEKVFRLKGSDHSPFFSKPQALHKLLVEISKIPSTQVQQAANDIDLQPAE